MHVFVTGGSGLVGSSLIPALIEAGHKVTALARSDASASKVTSLGATSIKGSHTDLEVLSNAASQADAVIHAAFNHEAMLSGKVVQACEEDRAAISALCDPIVGTGKTFMYTAGTFSNAGPDEKAGKVHNPHSPRPLSEELTLKYADKGVRAIVVRLPPVVHGPGFEHLFISTQIKVAKQSGVAVYVGDGTQVWSSVHVKDVAKLFVLALTNGPGGVNLHAVQEEGIPTKEIAEHIGKKLGVNTKSDTMEVAMQSYGMIGMIMSMGGRTTADYTKEWTGWEPTECGLFEEMEGYTW